MKKIEDGIWGLAVADALGVPVEFFSREKLKENPVIGMREYGTHNQPKGTWSDDTSMTLALMDSLAECGTVDEVDILNRFSVWLLYGDYTPFGEVFDVGNTVSRALFRYGKGIQPSECGGRAETDNGNGSLMRILPLAFFLAKHRELTSFARKEMIRRVSALTHGHDRSVIGCGIYVMIALELIKENKPLEEAVEWGIEQAFFLYGKEKEWQTYERIFSASQLKKLPERQIKSSGYVVHTLEAALWCLLNSDSYKECVLKAVNLGEDTDTVGAVAGGLAGIYYGIKGIPEKWKKELACPDRIKTICSKMQASLQ